MRALGPRAFRKRIKFFDFRWWVRRGVKQRPLRKRVKVFRLWLVGEG